MFKYSLDQLPPFITAFNNDHLSSLLLHERLWRNNYGFVRKALCHNPVFSIQSGVKRIFSTYILKVSGSLDWKAKKLKVLQKRRVVRLSEMTTSPAPRMGNKPEIRRTQSGTMDCSLEWAWDRRPSNGSVWAPDNSQTGTMVPRQEANMRWPPLWCHKDLGGRPCPRWTLLGVNTQAEHSTPETTPDTQGPQAQIKGVSEWWRKGNSRMWAQLG